MFCILNERKNEASDLSEDELMQKLHKYEKNPQKINMIVTQYERNFYVAELAKRQAKGVCQDCKRPAPFRSKKTGKPYLEAHHIVSLAKGGEDTIENVVALCPNCHRQRHFG